MKAEDINARFGLDFKQSHHARALDCSGARFIDRLLEQGEEQIRTRTMATTNASRTRYGDRVHCSPCKTLLRRHPQHAQERKLY